MSSAAVRSRAVGEVLLFTAAVIAYIWLFRSWAPSTLWLLVIVVAASFRRQGETLYSLGLSRRGFLKSVREWRLGWIASGVALFLFGLIGQPHLLSVQVVLHGVMHFAWCGVQQVVYQNMLYKGLRQAFGPSPKAWVLAGVLFAVAHLPNPVLTPTTLVWGILSSWLFERIPTIPSLAVFQMTLSAALLVLVPKEWHHGFRVGPGY